MSTVKNLLLSTAAIVAFAALASPAFASNAGGGQTNNASNLSSGTLPSARMTGDYTGITAIASTAMNAYNVKKYGALCDGTTQDDTAFTAAETAATAAGHPVYIPGSTNGCVLNNHVPVAGTTYIGNNVAINNYAASTAGESRLIPKSGAAEVFDLSGGRIAQMYGLDIDCKGANVMGVDSGGGLFADHIVIRGCNNNGYGNSSNTSNLNMISSLIYGNGSNADGGIVNVVDARVSNTSLSANNGNGAYLPTGANDDVFDNDKIEWNTSFGIYCYHCGHETYAANDVDRNYEGGYGFDTAFAISIPGNHMRRNGRNNTGGQDADFYFNGVSNGIVITGLSTDHGKDDNNTGNDTPQYVAYFNSSSDTNIVLEGDCSGVADGGQAVFFNSSVPGSLRINCNNATGNDFTIPIATAGVGKFIPVNNTNEAAVGDMVASEYNVGAGTYVTALNGTTTSATATSGTTAAGNATLHFTATDQTHCVANGFVIDVTAPSVIPAGTQISSTTSTTIVMSANATGAGVGSGNSIECFPSVTVNQNTLQAVFAAADLFFLPNSYTVTNFGATLFPAGVVIPGNLVIGSNMLISNVSPTISSGFGTGASISPAGIASTGSFLVGVGTGGSATTGVIGLPTAQNGWTCHCTDITTNSTTVSQTKQTGSSTTSCTVGNFNDVAVAAAWVASDNLACSAFAR